jgi:hypothetical protein
MRIAAHGSDRRLMNQVGLTARLDCFRAEAVISIAVLDSVAPDEKQHSSTMAGPLPLPHKGGAANATSAQTTCGNVLLDEHVLTGP